MKKHNFTSILHTLLACGTLHLSSFTLAQAESIEGVLEQSGSYSALFAASPESGDLIGYPFKSDTPIGKAILANCIPGLICKIGKVTTGEMRNTATLKFKDQPAGWLEITRAADIGIVSAINHYEKSVKTRFGTLAIDPNNPRLLLNGKPVLPSVEGNSSLGIVASYELGNADVVLVQNTGGTSCPALYTFITVTKTSQRATSEFGTCSDIIYPTSNVNNSVTLAMVGNKARKKVVFRYVDGQLTKAE